VSHIYDKRAVLAEKVCVVGTYPCIQHAIYMRGKKEEGGEWEGGGKGEERVRDA